MSGMEHSKEKLRNRGPNPEAPVNSTSAELYRPDNGKSMRRFFLFMLAAGAVLILLYLILTGNAHQVYTDVVNGYTSADGSNKSAERRLIYGLSIAGATVYTIYYLLKHRENPLQSANPPDASAASGSGSPAPVSSRDSLFASAASGSGSPAPASSRDSFFASADPQAPSSGYPGALSDHGPVYVIVALAVITAVEYFVNSSVNVLALTGVITSLILCVRKRSMVVPGVSFLFLCAYAVCGAYRLYVSLGGDYALNVKTAALLSMGLTLLLMIHGRETAYYRADLIAQLLIPFTLLIYLASRYLFKGEMVSISVPNQVRILIVAIIVLFVAEAAVKLLKNWKMTGAPAGPQAAQAANNAADSASGNSAASQAASAPAGPRARTGLQQVLTYGSCVVIMAFNLFLGKGAILSTDLHHPFENIIGYSQLVEMGREAFSQYIPVSGMYSVVHGFFLSFFGDGLASNYHVITNLFFLMAAALIVLLLRVQFPAEWVLFIALVFKITDYNRVTFIVPILLLLAWPALIKRKNLWLKVWFLSSFLHGLYYPIFGAAVCVAFLPLGIRQIRAYAASGELARDLRTASFWIWWIVCFVPVALGARLLLGTAKHMAAMAGQTIYADGIARFGQQVPECFFSYIQHLPVRLAIYYIFSFLLVIGIVWLSAALSLRYGRVSLRERRIRIEDPVPGCLFMTMGLMMLVAFTYTVVRMDINNIFARSEGVVCASFVMIVLLLSRYGKKDVNHFCAFGFAVLLLAVVSMDGFAQMGIDSKLDPYYTVPDDYVHAIDDRVERLGECFAQQETYDTIETAYEETAGAGREQAYLGKVTDFGLYYLCGLKGDSVLESETIRGYGAAQETVDLIRENHTVVGPVNTVNNYYLYNWLVTSGEYVWDAANRQFVPNDGSVSSEDVQAIHRNLDLAQEIVFLGKTANAWGCCMDSLQSVFGDSGVECSVYGDGTVAQAAFSRAVNGNDADWLYLEFAGVEDTYRYILFDHEEETTVDPELFGFAAGLLKKDYNTDMSVHVVWSDENGAEYSISCLMQEGRLLIPLGAGRNWLLQDHVGLRIEVTQNWKPAAMPEITGIRLLKLRAVE